MSSNQHYFQGKQKWKTRGEMLEDRAQEESESDELNRPKYKVLMLSGFGFKIFKKNHHFFLCKTQSGPPGLGKTTLAHVAAMHSGEFAKIEFLFDFFFKNFKKY